MTESSSKLFPALLKYWRGRRGLSQLDLSLTAGVSSKHVSFLETGRSSPSVEMVMLLGGVLDVPLRDRNELLRAAGYTPMFDEPPLDALSLPAIHRAVERMLTQQEPFPMIVMNRSYDVLRLNHAASRLLGLVMGEPPATGFNAIRILFEPGPLRDALVGWEAAAREMVSRLHRESLHWPNDAMLSELLDNVLEQPGVKKEWQAPDFARDAPAVLPFRFEVGGMEVGFLTTIMQFQAPQNITLEELRIESWFPLDAQTEEMCVALTEAKS